MQIRHYHLILMIAALSTLGFVFQMNPMMMPYGTSLRMRESRDRIENEKKARKEQIKQDLIDSKEKDTIHIYDQSLTHHRVLSKDLWSKVGVFKGMMENLSEGGDKSSQVEFLDVSDKTIDSIWLLLGSCQGISKEDDAFCVRVEAGSRDFDTLVSIANFMQHYHVEDLITNLFTKNLQQRLMDFFSGKLSLTQENAIAFDNANPDLRKAILPALWNIYLEKMRLHIAKNGKLGSKPNFFSCGVPNSYMTGISFSPDGKHVLVMPPYTDLWVNQKRLRVKMSVLNRYGIDWEFPCIAHHSTWINNNEFAYTDDYHGPQKLVIADNAMKSFQEIDVKRYIRNIIPFYKEKILFSYGDDSGKLGIGTCDQESKNITYNSLGELKGDVLGIDAMGRLLLHNKEENIVYRLKNFEDDRPERMLKLPQLMSVLTISPDGRKIAVRSIKQNTAANAVEIHSLETGNKLEYSCSFMINEFKFSQDSQYLILAGKKVLIVSALTEEIIGELDSSHQQIFESISAVDLSFDNNTLAIGTNSNQSSLQSVLGTMPNNVLLWDFIPTKYLPAWKKLQNLSSSLKKIHPIILWYYQSQNGKSPVKLSSTEKGTFHGFDYDVQQLLIDVGIIAPGQLGKKSQQLAQKIETQPEQSNKANQLQSQESILQKIMRATGAMAKDFFNYINKISNALPGSG